jgi:menaquinone-dependent protoporphyrinogen oxidase
MAPPAIVRLAAAWKLRRRGLFMHRILVAFASREGQTARIAHHIAHQIENRRLLARVVDIMAGETEAGADDCDAAIIAGSVHRGRYDPALAGFVMRHGPALRRVPSAFLSVSLSAASAVPHERAAIDEIAQRFLAEAGWAPDDVRHVAGAVHDRTIGVLERFALHTILKHHGVEPHQAGDTEHTDWAALDTFLRDFLSRVPAVGSAPDKGAEPPQES